MSKPNTGDILVASWGYDATWQDFYEVIAVTPSSVKVRKLKAERQRALNWDRAIVKPLIGQYTDDEILTRKVKDYGDGEYYIKVKDYCLAVSGRYEVGAEYVESIYS